MAAGGPNGRVYLWDKRANVGSQCMPATVLQSSQSGPPVVSVQLAERDGLVIAASSNGEVCYLVLFNMHMNHIINLYYNTIQIPHPFLLFYPSILFHFVPYSGQVLGCSRGQRGSPPFRWRRLPTPFARLHPYR